MTPPAPPTPPHPPGTVSLLVPTQPPKAPAWMQRWLWAAALYNVLFGAWVVLFPNSYFAWVGITPPNYPQLWQCIGMIVGVYGLGYFVAGFSPLTHWPIVLVGFLGKIFGPLGFLQSLVMGTLPWSFGWILLTNDLLWWIPFYGILAAAWRYYADEAGGFPESLTPTMALSAASTDTGENLLAMTQSRPVLLVCLRHFGCTFCREMVDDVMALRPLLPSTARVVFVTTGSIAQAQAFFAADRFAQTPPDAGKIAWISDPQRILYRALGLRRGTLGQVFGLRVWLRGVMAGIVKGYGVGTLEGDGFQMPGLFWFTPTTDPKHWLASHASDRVDSHILQKLID